MSHNLLFQYVKDALTTNGPLSRDGIVAELPDVTPAKVDTVLGWAVGNGSLTLDGGRYELTERGRR